MAVGVNRTYLSFECERLVSHDGERHSKTHELHRTDFLDHDKPATSGSIVFISGNIAGSSLVPGSLSRYDLVT